MLSVFSSFVPIWNSLKLLRSLSRPESVEIDEAPRPIPYLCFLLAEENDVDYGQNTDRVDDEQEDEPDLVAVARRSPQGDAFPHHLPQGADDEERPQKGCPDGEWPDWLHFSLLRYFSYPHPLSPPLPVGEGEGDGRGAPLL